MFLTIAAHHQMSRCVCHSSVSKCIQHWSSCSVFDLNTVLEVVLPQNIKTIEESRVVRSVRTLFVMPIILACMFPATSPPPSRHLPATSPPPPRHHSMQSIVFTYYQHLARAADNQDGQERKCRDQILSPVSQPALQDVVPVPGRHAMVWNEDRLHHLFVCGS